MRSMAATSKLALPALLCLGIALAQDTQEGADDAKVDRKPNRLIHEKSPYLQQHAYNPVDWYPWGAEAFDKARKEDKPVFLSIGYSTCHGCHLMERQSFEDEDVAAFLNGHFVSIKVDREERLDVDAIYMNACVRLTGGSGRWPVSVFLTADGKPFSGGAYYPSEDGLGDPGFLAILQAISDAWMKHRAELLQAGDRLARILDTSDYVPSDAPLDLAPLDLAFQRFAGAFDSEQGGFGAAPKFPRSFVLDLLLRYAQRTGTREALSLAEFTLQRMAEGGMYDQIGGGFHRYSTDVEWRVPHFEKMLYDNALLSRTYVAAWQATGKESYARIARECLDYVLVRLTCPDGGFYSAEDSESEGVEGKFYVWTPKEVAAVLGEADAAVVCCAYGIAEPGNFLASGMSASVPHLAFTAEQASGLLGTPLAEVQRILVDGRKKLFDARAMRVRPFRDEKIITSWNGLMISAMSRAGAALDEPRYVEAARRAATLLLEKSWKDGRLLRRRMEGEARFPGYLEDYAFLCEGLLDLYQATFEERWLDEAVRLGREMIRLFWNEEEGGFHDTGSDGEALLTRPSDPGDGAMPSGNSIAVGVLARLALVTGDDALRKKAELTIRRYLHYLTRVPTTYPQMLQGMEDLLTPRKRIVLAAKPDDPALAPMLRVVRRAFLPGAVVMLHPGGDAGEKLAARYPLLEGRAPADGVRAFVCEGATCDPPVSTPLELEGALTSW